MKNKIFKWTLFVGSAFMMNACELDEYNPNEVTGDEKLETFEIYNGLVNQCYTPLINTFYQSSDYIIMTEGGTDLWQSPKNGTNSSEILYYENLPANKSYVEKVWTFGYNTINMCNAVVDRAPKVTDADPNTLVQCIAQARCLRAYYYSVLVEQFGEITLSLNEATSGPELYPTRSSYADIYATIISDLKYAVANLPTSWNDSYARVTKKSALGLLCRAYIQGASHNLTDEGKSYLELAYETATRFIAEKDQYGAYLYPDFADVFNEKNNRNNKEALFIAAGANRNSEAYNAGYTQSEVFRHFLPSLGTYTDLGLVDKTNNFVYGRPNSNIFLPSKYLLECMMADPKDKRFQYSFITAYSAWSCLLYYNSGPLYDDKGKPNWNYPYSYETWGETYQLTESKCNKFGIDKKWIGARLYPHFELINNSTDELGIWNADGTAYINQDETDGNILHPDIPMPAPGADEDWQYAVYVSMKNLTPEQKAQYPCFVVNAFDLYEADGTPKTTTTINGSVVELETSIYPALSKFNMPGKEFFGSNVQRKTVDMTIMRFAEVYLIAAEASVRLGKNDAAQYLNVLRHRAGATQAPTSIDMNYIYDEYARELCGEFSRWYLLKRNHAFEARLKAYNPRAAKSFKPTNYLRPIPQKFLDAIYNATEYGQNPGY